MWNTICTIWEYPIGYLSLTLGLVYVCTKCTKIFNGKTEPPGPWGFPILGHLPRLGKRPFKTFEKWGKQYGDVIQIYMGTRRTVVVNSGELARKVLLEQSDDFAGRPPFSSFQYLSNGHSMAFETFSPQWTLHKKIANSTLIHIVQMRSKECDSFIIGEVDSFIDDILTSEGTPQSICNKIHYSVNSIMYHLCVGETGGNSLQMDEIFQKLMGGIMVVLKKQKAGGYIGDVLPFLDRFLHYKLNDMKARNEMYKTFIKRMEENHMKYYDSNHIRDLMDSLIKSFEDISDSGQVFNKSRHALMYTIVDFLGAGTSTLSSSISWGILYILTFPEIEDKLRQCIKDTLGDKAPQSSDIKQMPYMEAFLHEVWRISPPAPLLLPHYTTRDTYLNEFHIPKDTVVFVNGWAVSRDTRLWKNPERFDPDRFIDQDGKFDRNFKVDSFAFGAGRRRCIGSKLGLIENFLFITRLLQRCELSKVQNNQYSLEGEANLVFDPIDYELIVTRKKQ